MTSANRLFIETRPPMQYDYHRRTYQAEWQRGVFVANMMNSTTLPKLSFISAYSGGCVGGCVGVCAVV